MELAPKVATLIMRASEEQVDAWKEAATRADERSRASGGPRVTFSDWVRARLMEAYRRGE